MTSLTIALIAHVFIGFIGVIASYALLMGLLKKTLSHRLLKASSLIAFLSYIFSWVIGGYYYVVHYGAEVKPNIKEGAYPWAHTLIMESKEHIFLFLPVLAFLLALIMWLFEEELERDKALRKSTMTIALLTTLIGIFITLAGVVISGSVQ
jgi:hypothetical protein